MAFKLNHNKKNIILKNNTTANCVNEDQQVQEQPEMMRPKNKKKNRQKANSVCLPSGSNTNNSRSQSVPVRNLPTTSVSRMVRPYYPHYSGQTIRVPIVAAYPMYTYQPVPVVVNPLVASVYPYRCAVVPQVITPVVQPVVTEIPEELFDNNQETSVSYTNIIIEPNHDNVQYYEEQDENTYYENENIYEDDTPAEAADENNEIAEDSIATIDLSASALRDSNLDPIETYLLLPKALFPAPRTLLIDPNPIIDVFCKLKNVNKHVPWLLDLEYGIPKLPVTRHIPVYNVYHSNIFCKNTPDALHPGFNSCSDEFKEVFLFYYDSLISTLYTGYVAYNGETSVENFESWLLLPMQVLGMCWL